MTVFALIDPRDRRIRFVGSTKNRPGQRLSAHATGHHARTRAWASELRNLSLRPVIEILTTNGSEDEYISQLKPDLNGIPSKTKFSGKIRRGSSREDIRRYMREYRSLNRERLNVLRLEWEKRNPDYIAPNRTASVRKCKLKKLGMTVEQYEKIYRSQNGMCGICGGPPNSLGLVIDHCHKTGAARGLLCAGCNSMIGFAQDREEVLLAGVEYLRRTK